MTTKHRQYIESLSLDVINSTDSTTLAQMATDFCGYFVSSDTAQKLRKRILEQGGIIREVSSSQIEESIMREPSQDDLARLRQICEERGLPFDRWGIYWDKTRESSIAFYNKKAIEEDQARKAEMLAEMKRHAPKYPVIKYKKITDPHLMNIDVADLHIGKLALAAQTGADYNTDIAVKSAHAAVTELLRRARGYPIERFLFPIGNDILHVDSNANTTTKGTRQDVDGMSWQNCRIARIMYVEMIERLLRIAPVHVMYNSSNHDENSGFQLADALYCWFNKSKNITFDLDPKDRKYYQYGYNLIGGTHGHTAKAKDLPLLMATEVPRMWADTHYRYMHIHHVHHWSKIEFQTGKDHPGVTLQSMRSLSAPDVWHASMGYVGAPRAVDAFLYHPEYGQVNHFSAVFNK